VIPFSPGLFDRHNFFEGESPQINRALPGKGSAGQQEGGFSLGHGSVVELLPYKQD